MITTKLKGCTPFRRYLLLSGDMVHEFAPHDLHGKQIQRFAWSPAGAAIVGELPKVFGKFIVHLNSGGAGTAALNAGSDSNPTVIRAILPYEPAPPRLSP